MSQQEKPFFHRGRAVTKKGEGCGEETKQEGTWLMIPFELSWLVWFDFLKQLNMEASGNENFHSFCWCLRVACMVLGGQKEARASC